MKILLLANDCNWKSWPAKIQELKDFWNPEVPLDITLEHTSFKDIPWISYSANGKGRLGIDQTWYDLHISLPAVKRGFDCVIFTVNANDWPDASIDGWETYNNYGIYEIQIRGKEKAQYSYHGIKYPGDYWFNLARHELSHALYRAKNKQDNTHYWWQVGNLAQVKIELSGGFSQNALVRFWMNQYNPPTKYRYFNQSEIDGLKPALVELLDEARHIAGIPFYLNSTLRSAEKNEAVGGVKDSAHTKGLAVDIRCRNSSERWKIKNALYKVGFKRIGHGKTFVHADIDESKPQYVEWDY